jgi:RHS repeat-associated protein
MYRVTDVYTPNQKTIHYDYDGYGRQIKRTTPDAGLTTYSYDKNGNLIYSQDANQAGVSAGLSTYRNYDGLNRLTALGLVTLRLRDNPEDELPDEPFDNMGSTDSLLLVNVYDTLTSAVAALFNSPPSGYNSIAKNTKGNLVATAYRTRLGDPWNYKYYQYDARGRVSRMWQYIDGLGWKIINNAYNSQNQLTYLNYNPGEGDRKLFRYSYDDAARLSDVDVYVGYTPPPEELEGDFSGTYENFTSYTYNENSQVSDHDFKDGGLKTFYIYNNRNWVLAMQNNTPSTIFKYGMLYDLNGNVRTLLLQGSYHDNFSNNNNLSYTYVYDLSNRLLKADNYAEPENTFDLVNTYDDDGNFLTLKRYGSSDNIVDNFSYSYISGTNKLERVTGVNDLHTYDNCGNLTYDELNSNHDMIYDHRNLLVESQNNLSQFAYRMYYRYDEAGNRVSKRQYIYVMGEPPGGGTSPVGGGNDSIFTDEGDGSGYWAMVENIYYVRDVNGKEIAIYNNADLDQWNVWGLDNVGKITPDGNRYFYLKDHLGSIRATVNENYEVVSAQDYDAWGNVLQDRSFSPEINTYKFTGKERDLDIENNYDYFGARYYDSRIGNWGSVDPLLEKHIGWTPYNYVLRNPLILIDPNGRQAWFLAAAEAAVEAGIYIGIGYATYKVGEQLVKAYEEYTSEPPPVEIVTEKVEIAKEVMNPNLESRSKDLQKGITGAVKQILTHLEKIGSMDPNSKDPHNLKDKWKKDIEKQIKNIKKASEKLKKEPQKVIEELIQKGKLKKENIENAIDQLKSQGIEF